MDFTVYIEFPGQIKKEWNDLLGQSICNVPFLRFEYLQQWWRTRGGGEWPAEARLVLVTAHQEGALVGVAPLFHTVHQGVASLLFLGSIEISDFLSFIVRPQDLAAFTSGLLDTLQSDEGVPNWDRLDLYNNLEANGLASVLQEEATRRGWNIQTEQTDHSPLIHLPGDWETYLASLDKKQRHEIRRKMRRVSEGEVSSRWYIVEDGEALDGEIDAFFALMAFDPKKAEFLSTAMRDMMRSAIRSAFDEGYLQLAFLEIGGEKAAAYLNFDYINRLWVYNSGMNPQYAAYSSGWVLLGYLLQWANENVREAFDFMRGNEEYKYRFGAEDRFVSRIRLSL